MTPQPSDATYAIDQNESGGQDSERNEGDVLLGLQSLEALLVRIVCVRFSIICLLSKATPKKYMYNLRSQCVEHNSPL